MASFIWGPFEGVESGLLDPAQAKDYTFRSIQYAEVAELADAHDSNSCSLGIVGSIPTFGTHVNIAESQTMIRFC